MGIAGLLSKESLDYRLRDTKQFDYEDYVTIYWTDCIMKKSFAMPSLDYFFESNPKYYADMVQLYNDTFALFDGVLDIPDEVKAAQAAVIDSVCYFYDITQGKMCGLCTLSERLFAGGNVEIPEKVLKKAFEVNKVGNIHTFRVDIGYNYYGSGQFDYKYVAHKTVIDNNETVVLVPYVVGHMFSEAFKKILSRGSMVAVHQIMPDGSEKMRVVTEDDKHLSHYCDIEVSGMKSEFYPLAAYFYAPVLGAPSTTAMKTRIDLFNIEAVYNVNGYKECQKLGIQKPVDPVGDIFKEQAIIQVLNQLYVSDEEEYSRVIGKLPKTYVTNNITEGEVSSRNMSNLLHTLTRGQVNILLKKIPGAEDAYQSRLNLADSATQNAFAPHSSVIGSNLADALKGHLLKVVWKTSKGKYSSAICTNSRDILQSVYGEKYFSSYESYGVRVRAAADDISTLGMSVDVALKSYGFDESLAGEVKEAFMEKENNWEEAIYTGLGKKSNRGRAKTSSETVVTARTTSGYLTAKYQPGSTSPTAEDYYVSIDIEHLVSAEVLY